MRELEAQLRRASMERDILKSHGAVHRSPEVNCAFIQNHRDEFHLNVMCEVLEVSRSGFYDWQKREDPSDRKLRRVELDKLLEKEFRASRGSYGSPRVFEILKSQGIDMSQTTVERVMRELGLRAKSKRKFRVKTTDSNHDFGISPNLLQQRFDGYKPGEVLLGDITYIDTAEGWLYLATVMDLGAREIVGWAMPKKIDRHLVINAV